MFKRLREFFAEQRNKLLREELDHYKRVYNQQKVVIGELRAVNSEQWIFIQQLTTQIQNEKTEKNRTELASYTIN